MHVTSVVALAALFEDLLIQFSQQITSEGTWGVIASFRKSVNVYLHVLMMQTPSASNDWTTGDLI